MKNNLMDWHYSQNQFENGTRSSFKNMNILSSDHVSRLKASEGSALFDELIGFVSPIQDKFVGVYADWRMYKGIYHGHTLKFGELMDKLIMTAHRNIRHFLHKAVPFLAKEHTTTAYRRLKLWRAI